MYISISKFLVMAAKIVRPRVQDRAPLSSRSCAPTQRGKKGKKKNVFFLNGVVTRSFATPLSANMMPSFRESSRGHQKFQYPPKKLKHRKILRNGENTKYKNPYNRLPTGSF